MAPGKHCCIIGCHNSSHTYKGTKREHGFRFFRIPMVKRHHGKLMEEVTARRRRAWIAAIRRTNITFEHSGDSARVCSKHFHGGKPAYEMMETDPDWAPSLHLGHTEIKETDTSRHERQRTRKVKKVELQNQTQYQVQDATRDIQSDTGETEALHASVQEEQGTQCKNIQTDFLSTDIDNMKNEINRLLLEENRSLKEQIEKKEINLNSFERDDEKVKFYTGLPNFGTLLALFNFLSPNLPQGNRRFLSPFQLLIVTFLRLRLNLPVQHIAYMFGVHRTTISCAFMDTVSVMYTQLSPLVRWPDREILQATMPHQFVEAFGKKVAIIIDCFEIFIERPSNLHARAVTFSSYKHNNTQKYLIGITPKGLISFISKGWEGQASDKHITENCGFLKHLLPGDIVLADRGFDIAESVGLMCAEVKTPAFTKGQCQMHARDIEETRKIAHLRIHVERVIGNLSAKYTILTETVPIRLILPCKEEDVTFLDKIVKVCCALTNMSPSVV